MIGTTDCRRVPVFSREAWILAKCRPDLRILHVGCSDWPYTSQRIAEKRLLHSSILERNRSAEGLDVSEKGIGILRDVWPDAKFIVADATSLGDSGDRYDLVVLGEVLEHLSDPIAALVAIRPLLAPRGQLAVSVPNALSIKLALRGMVGREIVHPDHNCYYSPGTITQVLAKSGYDATVEGQYFADGGKKARIASKILAQMSRLAGSCSADGLLVVASQSVPVGEY